MDALRKSQSLRDARIFERAGALRACGARMEGGARFESALAVAWVLGVWVGWPQAGMMRWGGGDMGSLGPGC